MEMEAQDKAAIAGSSILQFFLKKVATTLAGFDLTTSLLGWAGGDYMYH
jgi:hypothetical protein